MKWMSNNLEVLSEIRDGEQMTPTLDLDLENLPAERTLGVQWDVEKDALLFKVHVPHQPLTKHGILSAVSSLHDPMGFVCPVVLCCVYTYGFYRGNGVYLPTRIFFSMCTHQLVPW